jgi:uncharacterized protein with HEPN domain
MTKHRDIVPLGGMLDTCHRVLKTTAKISRWDFDADEMLQDALTTCFKRLAGPRNESATKLAFSIRKSIGRT